MSRAHKSLRGFTGRSNVVSLDQRRKTKAPVEQAQAALKAAGREG